MLSRIREPGSIVAIGAPVFSVSLRDPVYVRAYVAERDLGKVVPGTSVEVTSDSSNKRYHGQIGYVSPRAEFTPKSVETTDLRTDLVYRLRVVVADADEGLRQGMPVTLMSHVGHRLIDMAAAVEIRDVVKRFGEVEALKGITADIEAGRLTGLVGPDGAGKTTLIRLMAALMSPTQGTVRVDGADIIGSAATVHAETGYMPQRFGLYEELSVMENLKLYARLRGLKGEGLDSTFGELLHFTRLEPFVDRRAGKLSGGMKQKLGLACALMARPKVLLLDEPSVGVDPVSRQDLWRMVQALTHDGMAVVWSTAYLDEAERCDAVLLLNEGRVEFDGPPRNLTTRVAGRSLSSRRYSK